MSITVSQVYKENIEPFPEYGKTICIIGCADDGPILHPYKASVDKEVSNTFGAESELTRAYHQAKDSGGDKIFLVRVDSSKDLYTELDKAYRVISSMPFHIIVPICAHFGDDEHNYALQLANHCYNSTNNYGERIGVIGVKPIDPELMERYRNNNEEDYLIKDHTNNLINNSKMKDGFYSDEEDIGGLISIVFSELLHKADNFETYVANGAVAYAGLLSRLKPSESPTNKLISSTVEFHYELPTYHIERAAFEFYSDTFCLLKRPENPIVVKDIATGIIYKEKIDYVVDKKSKEVKWLREEAKNTSILYSVDDCKELSMAGYVVFTRRPLVGIVPKSGKTPSLKSTLSNIESVRIVQSIAYTIKNAGLEISIGETSSRAAMFEEWAVKYLDSLVDRQEINDYNITFEHIKVGEINITLALSIFSELESVIVEILVS